MPLFLVEAYTGGGDGGAGEARTRAAEAASRGTDIVHVRTTFVPGDESVLHVFEAPSVERLAAAARSAALAVDRIVEVVECLAGGAETPARGSAES